MAKRGAHKKSKIIGAVRVDGRVEGAADIVALLRGVQAGFPA